MEGKRARIGHALTQYHINMVLSIYALNINVLSIQNPAISLAGIDIFVVVTL
jgi:hypothetical protein